MALTTIQSRSRCRIRCSDTEEICRDAQIDAHFPEGIDVFFDNVGGDTLEAALNHLNLRSRVVMCGGIANYNATTPQPGPTNIMNLVIMRSRMEGFIVSDYRHLDKDAVHDLSLWAKQGELKVVEDIKVVVVVVITVVVVSSLSQSTLPDVQVSAQLWSIWSQSCRSEQRPSRESYAQKLQPLN